MEGIFKKKTKTQKKKQISNKNITKTRKKEKERVLSRSGTRQIRFYATLPYHYNTKDDYVHLALRL